MMNVFYSILLSTVLISILSLVGALFLFLRKKTFDKILVFFVAFSAGTLLGGAFLHLLPEAVLGANISTLPLSGVFLSLLVGFIVFFVIEQFLGWCHCHTSGHNKVRDKKALGLLIIISDVIHNLIDGLLLAASFLISIPLGIATVIAIGMHEIPQEMGDFGVLVYSGMKKRKALFYNFLASTSIIVGGIVGYFVFDKIEGYLIYILAFTAGHFIYIASSDLIPEIKYKNGLDLKKAFISSLFFILGIFVMFLLKYLG